MGNRGANSIADIAACSTIDCFVSLIAPMGSDQWDRRASQAIVEHRPETPVPPRHVRWSKHSQALRMTDFLNAIKGLFASAITGAQYVVDGGRTATGGAVTQAMQS
jgi:hypothetical protein